MSLFDKIGASLTEGLSQVSDLFSKQNSAANQNTEANKTESVSFWTNLFGAKNTATPGFNQHAGLNFTAQNIDLSSAEIEAQNFKEAARLNPGQLPQDGRVGVYVVLKNDLAAPPEKAAAILNTLGFKDSDIAAYNERYQTDLVKELSVRLEGKIDKTAGRRVYDPKTKKDYFTGYIGVDAKVHRNLSDFLSARRASGEFPAASINNVKPANITLDPVTVTVAAGTTAGVAGVLVETMPLQIATDIIPRALETMGKVAPLVADIAAPVALIAAEVAPTVMIGDHAAKTYVEAKDRFDRGQAAQNYDAAREIAKATTVTMTMDDAEPLPLPQAETKPKAQPYAEPNAKPKVTDLLPAPTDLAPTGKAKPETQTRPDAPPIDITKLPQPNTEGLPRNAPPQQTSPSNPKDILPPIIGATTATLGKAAVDAINNNSKIVRTQPSLAPDINRSAEGIPEKTIPNSVIPDEIRQNEDIELQNKSADVLAQAGYKVKHRHNTRISAEEVKNNPLLKIGKRPDFEVEGKIFDHLAAREGTSVRNVVTRSIKRDKIDEGQATNFIVNLDKSNITFDQLKEQLEKYPVDGLDELIIIKDGKVTPFYPFEK